MKAIVKFKDGSTSLVRVNASYSQGGIHFYNLTLNALSTFLDFTPGKTDLYTGDKIEKLTYVMG